LRFIFNTICGGSHHPSSLDKTFFDFCFGESGEKISFHIRHGQNYKNGENSESGDIFWPLVKVLFKSQWRKWR
jgi:hypothetical protein